MDLKKYYNAKAIAMRLKQMPPLKTTVIDEFYTRKVNHPFDRVGKSDIASVGVPTPLISRGAASLPVGRGPLRLSDYEPFEVANHDFFTAADINAMKHLDDVSIQARLSGVDDNLRRICRITAEGIAAKSLTGTISWPVAVEGGALDTYTVDFGETLEHTATKKWDAADANVRTIFNDLQEMETKVQNEGYGGTVKFWAGKDAYNQLLTLAEVYGENPKAKMRVEVSAKGIDLGGFLIRKVAETYIDPATGKAAPKVPPGKIMAFAADAVHSLFYCALDDLDGKLQPLPYFSKPISVKDPSGIKIVGRSKPFPVPVVKAICWMAVLK